MLILFCCYDESPERNTLKSGTVFWSRGYRAFSHELLALGTRQCLLWSVCWKRLLTSQWPERQRKRRGGIGKVLFPFFGYTWLHNISFSREAHANPWSSMGEVSGLRIQSLPHRTTSWGSHLNTLTFWGDTLNSNPYRYCVCGQRNHWSDSSCLPVRLSRI